MTTSMSLVRPTSRLVQWRYSQRILMTLECEEYQNPSMFGVSLCWALCWLLLGGTLVLLLLLLLLFLFLSPVPLLRAAAMAQGMICPPGLSAAPQHCAQN